MPEKVKKKGPKSAKTMPLTEKEKKKKPKPLRVRSASTRKLLRDVEGQDDSVRKSAKRKATLRRKKSQRG